MEAFGSLAALSHSLGVSPARLEANRLDFQHDGAGVIARLDAMYSRLDARHGGASRMDSTQRRDAANVFATNSLSQMLTGVSRPINEQQYWFAPGRAERPLIPIRQTVPLGKNQMQWPVDAISGEAQVIAPGGGIRHLTKPVQANDQKTQPVILWGARWGWDQFELWQARHTKQAIQNERREGAMQGMDEFAERFFKYGNDEHKVPGFFQNGAAHTFTLPENFARANLTALELLTNLFEIHLMWKAANPDGRRPTGVVMPDTHHVAMQMIFTDDGSTLMWPMVVRMFPWLANPVTDDSMLTASSSNGPMWQMWSQDSVELYGEMMPPQLYGPFDDELNTDFVVIAQGGGVVNKNSRLICRFEQPTI